jgi:multicomponent Na+:H+ antiporter subunit F
VNVLLPALLLFLFGNLAAGLWRVHRGPTAADRMLSALLIGSTSVAVVLLLAEWQQLAALRVAALLVVMLAAVLSIAFAAIAQGARTSAPAGTPRDAPQGAQARPPTSPLADPAAER